MDRTQGSSHLLIGLLVAALAAVDLALFTLPGPGIHSSTLWLGISVSLPLSQASLLTIWMVLGRGWAPVRFAAWVLGVTALSVGMIRLEKEFGSIVPIHSAAVLVPLVVLRIRGLKLAPPVAPALFLRGAMTLTAPDAAPEQPEALAPRQFSILYLLAWTTALAILLSAVTSLVGWEFLGKLADVTIESGFWYFVLFMLGRALVMLAVLWAILATRRRWPALVLLTIALVGVGLWTAPSISSGGLARAIALALVYWLALEIALLAGFLAVVRIAGYRLERG